VDRVRILRRLRAIIYESRRYSDNGSWRRADCGADSGSPSGVYLAGGVALPLAGFYIPAGPRAGQTIGVCRLSFTRHDWGEKPRPYGRLDRGRDTGYQAPPAQTRAGAR
jgi:hypothetical protein